MPGSAESPAFTCDQDLWMRTETGRSHPTVCCDATSSHSVACNLVEAAMGRGEQTRPEIICKAAPIFNQNDYEGCVVRPDGGHGCVFTSALAPDQSLTTIELKMNFPSPVWQARLSAKDSLMGSLRVWIFSTLMRLRPSHKLKQPVIHYRGHRHMSLR